MTLEITLNEFDATRKLQLVCAIAGFLGIPVESVNVLSVEAGSVKVFVGLLPADASRLLHAHAIGDPRLKEHFGDLTVSGIRTITEDTIAHRAYELWRENGSPDAKEMDFWVQAEREILAAMNVRLGRFVASNVAFVGSLNHTIEKLADPQQRGPRLTDYLIENGLSVARQSLQRMTECDLWLELFGFGDAEWVPVTSDGQAMAAKVLFHEDVLISENLTGNTDDLGSQGHLSGAVAELLSQEGIRSIAVWHVHAVDTHAGQKVRPALVLYAFASERDVFRDELTRLLLDQCAAQLGLALAVGQRDELWNERPIRSLRPADS